MVLGIVEVRGRAVVETFLWSINNVSSILLLLLFVANPRDKDKFVTGGSQFYAVPAVIVRTQVRSRKNK